ncbi:hypothetical protein B5M44_26210 [Shinella sumterensis]|uniref:hypothetical protein n=1 Tax=Shinella sumterensis TaxID=1967501 RepID=UPI00106DF12D|nr:hypothetical protein [Shinella sumterensis]MCD1267223.1 hypothetical protein [Shinella sumterensis]TFE92451.1 hypothetical protein B5M44_26210 [Shinella sumterensis]
MSTMPAWIQVLQALLTPAIAIAVGVIALMQWRTAHQKVVLDLFDRRLAVLNEVEEVINHALSTTGNLVGVNAAMRLYDCEAKALFLFGSEIVDVIGKIRKELLVYHKPKTKMTSTEQLELIGEPDQAFFRIAGLQQNLANAVLPFMRMHSKVVPTPTEWFSDRNKLRLSYGDEKQ